MELQQLTLLAILILLIDMPWLWYIGDKFGSMVQRIQGGRPLEFRLLGAVPVYFALAYLLSRASDMKTAFLIGLCTYAVYDGTNYATLGGYELGVGLMDSLWGGVLFTIAFTLAKQFKIL